MTLPVIFHALAERELNDAAAYYYAQERPGLGGAFLAEVERVVRLIAEKPMAGTAAREDIRRWRLRRFPYEVIYRIRADHIRILAIAAHKRRPSYWLGRR
ncbi:type II toxin-antitoxin system RelE/ParE family toxin [Polyangium aurulentum]|uniref:type II toxin-antitoxin system RelE/ParE family toxin n=1 Tax=Polyangium aurulentum TaxID=2567896 RepID=UPI0010AEE599|nr:type II toxin-antitoxin system RelE/ParE family toxin [Polyangium aurulentum]UQA62916.1 type II toxin-antitoxin system RelE/ParE family toxin [Polyangium aurulentum]